MATIQCKQCGGTLELPEGVTAGECPYCGSYTTFPKLADSQGEQLYNRAEQFRHNNDFDRAEQAYGQYIQASPQDPEGYWGLVLSRFGIEYVEDPATHERIPTCHRVQDSPVTSDPDYLQAVELAVGSDRDIYEREAKRIEEIQQGILAISAQEKPYDVFICYKESTDGGTRTRDSVDAQEIYYQLTNQGFKVFFSRITLEGKLGSEYEPYIFAALNSAKVMLVIGSCKEFFEAVWVRNEWSRFIALMKKNPGKLIIPCFKGMSPYDLPPELSRFQAQDMSKIGFIQDLLHGIKKVINKEGEKQGGSGSSSGSDKLANLLRRAKLFAENGDFDSAKEYCEKVLDQDAENGYAYFYRLMAELKVTNEEGLVKVGDLPEQKSFKLAQRFADGELKARLDGILKAQADARAEEERRQQEKKRRWEEAQKAAAEAERRRQEEEAAALERQREEERIRMEAQSRIELLGQCIKAELFLHGKSVLHEELVRCISAENDLSGSPDPDREIQIKAASETAMAQAGGVAELERKVKRKKVMRRVIAVVIVSAALLITVKIVSCARDNARIGTEFTAAQNAAATFNWRDVVAHAKTALSVDPGHAGAKALLERAQYILAEFGKAETAEKASRWDEVLKHARNILGKAPDDAAAKTLRAQAEYIISELEKAETARKNSRWEELLAHARNILAKAPDDGTAKDLQTLAEAHRGNAEAQYKLGERYLSGKGVVKDEAEAMKWFRKAAEQGNVAAQAALALKNAPTTFLLPGSVSLEMVRIKAGMFLMGSPRGEMGRSDDEAQHRVTISKPFLIGKYEVTQKQWQAVMGGNPSRFKGDDRPVESVSWDDAKLFCDKLNKLFAGKLPKGYRFDLPTEAQWEYACRAGTTTALNNGKDLVSEGEQKCPNLDEVGWYDGNSNRSTHPVGQKRPNAWGLYDMHGNVWEWCRDWYGDYGGDATDPVGPASGSDRVCRGGGWVSLYWSCRSAHRYNGCDPGNRDDDLGFRLALVPVQ